MRGAACRADDWCRAASDTSQQYAELIWQLLGGDKTQQAVADELDWSRGQVSQYAMLQQIDAEAWAIVATTVRDVGLLREDGAVADDAPPVAFTENLLRVLPPLLPEQQQAVADDLGWSRENVKNHAALQKIDIKAWQIVGTAVRESNLVRESDDVPSGGTAVPFTERLLRVLPPLLPEQQQADCRFQRPFKL
jgi:hypothetical protein